MTPQRLVLLLTAIMLTIYATAQVSDNTAQTISPKYLDKVSAANSRIEKKLEKTSAKALRQLKKQEAKLQRKLYARDSTKATAIFGDAKVQYANLEQRLQNPGSFKQYIPSLDTLNTSLKFLQQAPQFLGASKDAGQKLTTASGKVKALEDQFQKADAIKKFLKERKEYLKQQLGQLGFARQFKQLNKQAYYYSEQVNEYKELLKDHTKIEKKAIDLLNKTKLFKDFMQKNSQLASLFRLPGDPNDPTAQAGLAGLQTRVQVSSLIQQQLGSGGSNAMTQFKQNMQDAQNQMNQLKNKLNQYGKSSSDAGMPEGFTPNNQRVKSFLQRIELGTNIQSQRASGFFPTTSDIGLSIGYKLNDKSIIGVGASYKIGWGKDIRHIDITHEGVGLRSFIDYKIKGSFWITGGYEMNYRQFPQIAATVSTPPLGGWGAQYSGLIGVSKMISLKTKFFKQTKLQLLCDLLSYQQVPRAQQIVFRIAYNVK